MLGGRHSPSVSSERETVHRFFGYFGFFRVFCGFVHRRGITISSRETGSLDMSKQGKAGVAVDLRVAGSSAQGAWSLSASVAATSVPDGKSPASCAQYPRDRGMPTKEALRAYGHQNVDDIVIIDSI